MNLYTKMRSFFLHRAFLYSLALLIQILLLFWVVLGFQNRLYVFYSFSTAISVVAVIIILNNSSNPAYKIAWLIPILVMPVFGSIMYYLIGRTKLRSSMRRTLIHTEHKKQQVLEKEPTILDTITAMDTDAGCQSKYLQDYADNPPYAHTLSTYFPTGEQSWLALLDALKNAQSFIFLEYFIIQEGTMWEAVLDILKEKAKEGLDVRVMYDDAGCIMKLPKGYNRYLEKYGIQCGVFNPVRPFLNSMMNHRNHRKIAVIDGTTGFTGGINIADEYINSVEKYGHWKDTSIQIQGDGVWSLTLMFLRLWDYVHGEPRDYGYYKPRESLPKRKTDGFVQPFDDSPLDDERVGENVYLNILNRSHSYVYITTPYLIIDNEMLTALLLASKSGVDVRIITPHIGDKWYVHGVTRTFYRQLIEGGVRIFEYLPGFIHSKTFVADDKYGVVGTINMDFRSLFLHFECGIWLYNTSSIEDMKADFLETQRRSQEMTLRDIRHFSLAQKIAGQFFRVFSPLL